jgi:hypothetical protein
MASSFTDTLSKSYSLSSASYAARRVEEFRGERFELLQVHHALPDLLCEECRVLLDERERWQRLETQKNVSESIWSVNA